MDTVAAGNDQQDRVSWVAEVSSDMTTWKAAGSCRFIGAAPALRWAVEPVVLPCTRKLGPKPGLSYARILDNNDLQHHCVHEDHQPEGARSLGSDD
jgi:hypothetical protein